MIVCIDKNNTVLWLNNDDTIKQNELYASNPNILLVKKEVSFVQEPEDDGIYVQKWNYESEEIYIERVGIKLPTDRELLEESVRTTAQISDDTMINMEMGVETNQAVLLTQEDGLVIMELLLDIQSKLTTQEA